jgi:hypothetical protein
MLRLFNKRQSWGSEGPWDAGLQDLVQSGQLTGYALISRSGRCEVAEGLLNAEMQDQSVLQQFTGIFHAHDKAPLAFDVAGEHVIVFRRTESDLHAISKHRSLGLSVSALPFGVLVSTFARPNLPQMVLPQVQKIVDRLRK